MGILITLCFYPLLWICKTILFFAVCYKYCIFCTYSKNKQLSTFVFFILVSKSRVTLTFSVVTWQKTKKSKRKKPSQALHVPVLFFFLYILGIRFPFWLICLFERLRYSIMDFLEAGESICHMSVDSRYVPEPMLTLSGAADERLSREVITIPDN